MEKTYKRTVSFDQFVDFPSIADSGITSRVVFSNRAYKNLMRLINESKVDGEMAVEQGCIFIGRAVRNKDNESIVLIDDYTCDFETTDAFVKDGGLDVDKAVDDLNRKNFVGTFLFHFHTHPRKLHFESFSDQDLFSYLEFANQPACVNRGVFVSGLLATPNRGSNKLSDNVQLSMVFCGSSSSYVSEDMDDYEKFVETVRVHFYRWPSICYVDDNSDIVSFGEYMRKAAPPLTGGRTSKGNVPVTAFGIDPNTGLEIPTEVVGHFVSSDDFSIFSKASEVTSDLKDDATDEMTYADKLNEEFLKLLEELKNPSYDRKERSKFVIRTKQIIDIYRNEFNNDAFADTLVKAFNKSQAVYESELKKKESTDLEPKRKGKHFASSKPKEFKSVSLEEDKPITISEGMESKLDEDAQGRVQEIDDRVYKTSAQKVDEMLEKKMNEIHERVDNGETLDSKIDDLSRYVSDLKQRRREISEQFKDVWVFGDDKRFDELLEEDNKTKLLISQNESEIKRRTEIRDMVDEQIAREEVTRDIERFESDVDFVNNGNFTDEQKKILIDGIYAEFDKYVEEHPEERRRSR